MPTFRERNVLTGITVAQAMQRVVIRMDVEDPISLGVRLMIKAKVDAVLVDDGQGQYQGVVSKTDVMGAFYAGLPWDTPVGDIMMAPVQVCWPDDGIDQVLDIMKQNRIHQIYAGIPSQGTIEGILGYADIVGLLYRYCRQCAQSHRARNAEKDRPRVTAGEIMTAQVQVCRRSDTLYQVMDILSERKLKALPVVDDQGMPLGIISKTDLVLAYVHDILPDRPAGRIMNAPMAACEPDTLMSDVILQMFFSDIQHLFVTEKAKGKIQGVISLSDAARFRSGTCRACTASRVLDRM